MTTRSREIAAKGTETVMAHKGGPEALQARRRYLPRPEAGEAVVRVEAAGVSFAEVQLLRGRYSNRPRFPFVPGYDLAYTVSQVGDGARERCLGGREPSTLPQPCWCTSGPRDRDSSYR